jgi:hypothetical protein
VQSVVIKMGANRKVDLGTKEYDVRADIEAGTSLHTVRLADTKRDL